MKMETLKQQILTAKGDVRAELVLKNARVINVFTNEIEQADVAIRQGVILGVGHYTGETELDLQGKYVCPGLVDGHIHIESSMLCGPAFEQAVLPHGTTAVVTDPHEISNVAGTAGLDFMLETTKDLALSVYFMLPSCVPATGLDESGAVLEAEQLRPYYQQPRVLGLAELMNSYGTVRADEKILQKICDCTAAGKRIDGHAPFLSGEELNAYVVAGVQSDHECSDIHEAMEKLRRGQYIMVLAGNTVRKNKGGLAFALNGQVVGELPLPVAGLMSTESAETVEEKLQALKAALKAHGISEDIDAFMTLAFVSLPVIPKLRLNTYGIVDVEAQQIVPAVF